MSDAASGMLPGSLPLLLSLFSALQDHSSWQLAITLVLFTIPGAQQLTGIALFSEFKSAAQSTFGVPPGLRSFFICGLREKSWKDSFNLAFILLREAEEWFIRSTW